MFIDAHCHLERETYGEELAAVIARAKNAGVNYLIAVGASNGVAGIREAVALAENNPHIYAAIGLHPHEADKIGPSDEAALAEQLKHPKVVALGEVGLDYHYNFSAPETQRQLFKRMLALSKTVDLPVMLHVRKAHQDTLAILDQIGLPSKGGVVHCFTGNWAEAQGYLNRKMFLSIPGAVTFRNADELRSAIKQIPLEQLLIETDSPYLSPVPHRGQRNEPAMVVKTAETIAQIHALNTEDIGRITAQNAIRLFRLPLKTEAAIAYPIRNSVYINHTNRCTLACKFCPKIEHKNWWVMGHYLKLDREPSVPEIIDALERVLARRTDIQEIVFVGLGEPTLRLPELLETGRQIRATYGQRYKLRLDTDGLANLVHGYDVTPKLAQIFDALSVSLNAPSAEEYARLCPSRYSQSAYPAIKDFIASAQKARLDVTASVVGVPNLNQNACRQIVEEVLKVRFRLRPYQSLG